MLARPAQPTDGDGGAFSLPRSACARLALVALQVDESAEPYPRID
jgi:hypothetical protein